MPTSRPTTPAATSDTSSDPESLSDLDSGWTDLESNRSTGRRSPTISEASDDARSVMDRFEAEAWEGLAPEAREHTTGLAPLVTDPLHPSPDDQHRPSEPSLEDWVSDAMMSSMLSDHNGLHASTPQASVSSRSALRLSFPDPLSSSDHDLLPSHLLSPTCSRIADNFPSQLPDDSEAHDEALSPVTETGLSEANTTNDNNQYSPLEHDDEESDFEMPSVELAPPSVSYALSIVLLGHPPLPHLKRTTMSTLIDMVAKAIDGTPRGLEGSEFTRIYEVPFYPHDKEAQTESSTHRVLISDYTSGISLTPSFTGFDCPTLALVFIQPPLSPPSLPVLSLNTRYVPLLLPSVSDGFASSLLDLSPSVLFDSEPDISNADSASRKKFALQQCREMDILSRRLVESQDILTVEEFIEPPTEWISTALKAVLFPPEETFTEAQEVEKDQDAVDQGGATVFRKQLVFISAFLLAILFGSTVFLLSYSEANQGTGYKVWSFLQPYVNRTPAVQPPSSRTTPQSPQSIVPASLRSLAVSVFRPESTANKIASTSTETQSLPKKGKTKRNRTVNNSHEVRPASIEPAVRPLTLDGPSRKTLSVVPQSQRTMGKGKETAVDAPIESQLPYASSITSLSTRISNALSPLFDRANQDMREIQEAIDVLLHALWKLKGQASLGIGELVQVLSKHAGQRVEDLAGEVQRRAQTVSERVSARHARAKFNARKVRDVGERYVSAARQKFGWGVERARGNAKVLKEGLKMARKESRWGREQTRKLKRDAREERKSARKEARAKNQESKRRASGEMIFRRVMALVTA